MTEKITSRIGALGMTGRKGTAENTQDAFIKIREFPVTLVASDTAQATGIVAPKSVQALGAYINVITPEATGTTPTVSFGLVGAAAAFLSAETVTAAGAVGTPIPAAVNNASGAEFAYRLGSADFAELEATIVFCYLGSDE